MMSHKLFLIVSAAFLSFALSACEELFNTDCQSSLVRPMVRVDMSAAPLGYSFNIDAYEASRGDATATDAGLGTGSACHYANTKPWGYVSYQDAKLACAEVGKRLCTRNEWMSACQQKGLYPYGDRYEAGACNDKKAGSTPTGSFANCRTDIGIFDMSGNLREWVEEGLLLGGAYSSSHNDLTCESMLAPPDRFNYSPTAADGFRCCQTL